MQSAWKYSRISFAFFINPIGASSGIESRSEPPLFWSVLVRIKVRTRPHMPSGISVGGKRITGRVTNQSAACHRLAKRSKMVQSSTFVLLYFCPLLFGKFPFQGVICRGMPRLLLNLVIGVFQHATACSVDPGLETRTVECASHSSD